MTEKTDSPVENEVEQLVHWVIPPQHQTKSLLSLVEEITGKKTFKTTHNIEITGTLAHWGQFILARFARGQDKNWIRDLEPSLTVNGDLSQSPNVHTIQGQPLKVVF